MRTYRGMLGYRGQPELSVFAGYTPMTGDDFDAAVYRLKRVVRSAAALSGEKATIYALHDGLPPMAALRVTSNGGSAPLLREVPLAVAGHTPSLASVQWLADSLAGRLGRIRVAMGFGSAADSGLRGKTLEEVALAALVGVNVLSYRAWSLTAGAALFGQSFSLESLAKVGDRPQRTEAIVVGTKATKPMRASLCWAGGEPNANGARYGIVSVDVEEAPRPIARAYSSLRAALDAASGEGMERIGTLCTQSELDPVFARELHVRPAVSRGDGCIARPCATLAEVQEWEREHGVAVWMPCDKHGVALWQRPDLVAVAQEKIAHAIRAVERIVGRRGEVPHLPQLASALDALRANADFARKP